MRIHFICRGNTFRSRIAEAYLRSLKVPGLQVISSGTVADVVRRENMEAERNIAMIMKSRGLHMFWKKRSSQLTRKRLRAKDVVICVNERVHKEFKKLIPTSKDVIVWNINDLDEVANQPKTLGQKTIFVVKTLKNIQKEVDKLVRKIKKV